ncbi:MAG: LysR substrate-binding domain-containing protein [Pseudohongiellaceae bacterium]
MHFTLKQLQVFLAVASHENVSRAAVELALSQSATSTALKELEQRFGLVLFDRIGKRLQLNESGRLFRPRAAALMAQARELDSAMLQHSEVGEFRVGATLTIGNYLAIPILARFVQEHPGARVQLDVANTATVARKVQNFELDIGLIEGELQEPDLESSWWRDDELCLFCAPDHPWAGRGPLSDADLLAAEWIVRETGSGTRQAFDRAMTGLLPRLNVRLELQHTEGIKRAVEAGLGLGCLSTLTLKDAFARGSLVPLTAPQRNWTRQFYFILHREKYRSRGIRDWIAMCRQAEPAYTSL